MKTFINLFLVFFCCLSIAFNVQFVQAQPGAIATNNLNGSPYNCMALTDLGSFRQARIQATQTSSAATWEFPTDCSFPGDVWRPYNAGNCSTPLSLNTVIPPIGGSCSALSNSINGGVAGNLATTTNKYPVLYSLT